RDAMGGPDILTLQEVENQRVLDDLVRRPELAGLGYEAVLREGRDPRSIDVAVLYKRDKFHVLQVEQWDPTSKSPSGRPTKSFTGPPLVVRFAPNAGVNQARDGVGEFSVVSLHFTSRLQGSDGERRRMQQAQGIVDAMKAARALEPNRIMVLSG